MSSNWKNILISPESTIRNALQVINIEALRTALVVDDKLQLLGVITDGDIRRGLISGLSLEDCVSKVMNTSPVTASIYETKSSLAKLMNSKGILSIPLLKENKVVGLEVFKHAIAKPEYKNPVFIMAGGFGSRLRPLTDNCPKPMLTIGDKPLLETILTSFIRNGFSNFYISLHYLPEKVASYFGDGSQWNVNINYLNESSPLGTGGALGLLPENIPDLPIIMINGDILTKLDFEKLLEFHNSSYSDITVCVRDYEVQIPYGVINNVGADITCIKEKPIQRYFINAGIYVINKKTINSIPKNKKIDMPAILEKSIESKNTVSMFPVHEYWLDIGQMNDFQKAQMDFNALNIGEEVD